MLLFKASIKQYNNIPKINNIDFMIDNVKTPKEAIDGLLVTLVQNSDERIVKNYFDTLDNKGVFNQLNYCKNNGTSTLTSLVACFILGKVYCRTY